MSYCLNPACPQPQNPADANYCQTCGTPLILAERYRAISLIGQGGFGRTLLAEAAGRDSGDTPSGRCVIKQRIFNRGRLSSADLDLSKSFQQEAERLQRLGEHPQIPRLLDYVETELGQFLIQDWIAGPNLEQRLAAEGPWAEPLLQNLLKSLLTVLEYVHSFQIIHRDLKPANIIWAAPAPPVLVDFGAAKQLSRLESPQTGTVIGSAGYAAPEQTMGQAVYASDLYSLGVVCIHLLTGLHPFDLYSVSEDRWVWQTYLTQPVTPHLAQVLDGLLARSLQQRYPTAAAANQALKQNRYSLKPLLNQVRSRLIPSIQAPIHLGRETLPHHPITPSRQTWHPHHRLTPPGLTQALAISPDSRTLATAGQDAAIRLWDLNRGECLHTFRRGRLLGGGHRDRVTALQFHPDGRVLYSSSEDGTLKEWDVGEYQLLNTLPAQGWTPTALSLTADGKTLISAGVAGQITFWDIATLTPRQTLAPHRERVTALVSTEHQLASASWDGTVRLWQLPELKPIKSFKAHDAQVTALALRPQGDYLVSGGSEGIVKRWTLNGQIVQTPLYTATSGITALALCPGKPHLAVGSGDSLLTIWQIETGDCMAKIEHGWGLVAIAFTPDGQTLVTSSADEVISVWQRKESG
ncbi:protein kinase [Romeria aff. gracilis LEGE 07310]|uniref:Protein kinase n=1 Tax=Vasconcelosia minhoensis LEGE 07310 TaxID=915328 RepID=A0A8J7A6H1_9CYAN|nr:WD40 repeat domain-containing serine/threonine-protein kinase [Romeria gracilis]MBE9076780.1 protein kinase [Romeria aff. gracilis LEGE 07310]